MHSPEHHDQLSFQESMLKGHKNAIFTAWIVIHEFAESQD